VGELKRIFLTYRDLLHSLASRFPVVIHFPFNLSVLLGDVKPTVDTTVVRLLHITSAGVERCSPVKQASYTFTLRCFIRVVVHALLACMVSSVAVV
jgi:hypothetical protein